MIKVHSCKTFVRSSSPIYDRLSPSNNEIVEGPPLYWLNVILAESMFPRLIVLEPFPSISE